MSTRRVILMLSILAVPAYAQEQEAAELDPIELCGMLGETSDSIFRARNTGVPLTQLLQVVNGSLEEGESEDDWIHRVNESMIRDIYALQRFATEEYQARQAAEFRAAFELECLEVLEAQE